MLQDRGECLDVRTHKAHLIISPAFPRTPGELPSKGKPCDLPRVGGFCLLPWSRRICRKMENGRTAPARCPVRPALAPGSSGCRWEEESGLDKGASSPGSSAQGSEAVTPGANKGSQLAGLLQPLAVGQKGCNLALVLSFDHPAAVDEAKCLLPPS